MQHVVHSPDKMSLQLAKHGSVKCIRQEKSNTRCCTKGQSIGEVGWISRDKPPCKKVNTKNRMDVVTVRKKDARPARQNRLPPNACNSNDR